MAKIFYEDAYCLGLLYSYLFAGKKMVLKDDLEFFYRTIEKNLENSDVMDIYATIWHDSDPCIYYPSEGRNGDVYYILYPDFDLKKAKSKYIGCLSADVLVASQKDNALSCLGLQLKDGHICKKEEHQVEVSDSMLFMSKFIKKLKNGELKIETCPQIDNGDDLTDDFIIKQLESYQKLLDTNIINNVSEDDALLVKSIKDNYNVDKK